MNQIETIDPNDLQPVAATLGGVAVAALRLAVVHRAAEDLRRHRSALREVGAYAAADYCARALKSVEGAERHAARLLNEARERAR